MKKLLLALLLSAPASAAPIVTWKDLAVQPFTFQGIDQTGFTLKTSSTVLVQNGGGVCFGSISPANCQYGPSVGANLVGNNTWTGTNTFNNTVSVNGTIMLNGIPLADNAWQSKGFTTATTFTVPATSSMVYVSLCGAGASGASNGGGGSSGITLWEVPLNVSHGQTITISQIGVGGAAATLGNDGNPGTATIITYTDPVLGAVTITAPGGGPGLGGGVPCNGGYVHGYMAPNGSCLLGSFGITAAADDIIVGTQGKWPFIAAGGGGQCGGSNETCVSDANTSPGGPSFRNPGGAAGCAGTNCGGGGGSSPWGIGGDGSNGATPGSAGTGRCSGGGGSGANFANSGAGTNGYVLFSWVGTP